MQQPWFKDWFNSPYYHQLYFNRDDREAAVFIDKLISYLKPAPDSTMLDVACGRGRHSIQLAGIGERRRRSRFRRPAVDPGHIAGLFRWQRRRGLPGQPGQHGWAHHLDQFQSECRAELLGDLGPGPEHGIEHRWTGGKERTEAIHLARLWQGGTAVDDQMGRR